MAVSRQMISDAVTDEIKEELTLLIRDLAGIPDREARQVRFSAAMEDTLSDDAARLVTLVTQKERMHIAHVTATLAAIGEYPKDRPAHDFSKDAMYFFVTSCKFDCQIRDDVLEQLFQAEFKRHYGLEPHHPEYEDIHGRECSADDILEMSVDRMSRCIQANQGRVVMANMRKYLPNFTLGDNTAKQGLFLSLVEKYTELAEKMYAEVYAALQAQA